MAHIIRVSYDRTFSNEFPTAIVGDADSLFHPVQGDVGQQGRRDPTLRRSMLRCVEHLLLDVSRFQPLFDQFLAGNWANDLQEIVVCNVVERSHNSIPYSTTQMKRTGQRLKSAIQRIPCSDVASR